MWGHIRPSSLKTCKFGPRSCLCKIRETLWAARAGGEGVAAITKTATVAPSLLGPSRVGLRLFEPCTLRIHFPF